MPSAGKLSANVLLKYNDMYDPQHEDVAFETRGEFLRAFPHKGLHNLKIDDYVIGLQRPTFCSYVEAKTRAWANIQGATAFKFGIFFGKSGNDTERDYRFAKKFGETRLKAFAGVKEALLDLIHLAKAKDLDFKAIDANPISQMFKAKILSLYFPDRFLNVCSGEHLEELATILGFRENAPWSEYQHCLLLAKQNTSVSKDWSNPKFMSFLYDTYLNEDQVEEDVPKKPQQRSKKVVDFDEINAERVRIGKAAEEFALEWEKRRLEGCELGHMATDIVDRRDRPGYGYDFLSFSSAKRSRYIEVKSVGKLPRGEGYRFFLSANEHEISISPEHSDEYYFYMVLFDGNGKPMSLIPTRAGSLYDFCELLPGSYIVRFDL